MLLTRSPLYSRSCPRFLVRLACVRHAASVDSEPGSNSRLKPESPRDGVSGTCQSRSKGDWPLYCEIVWTSNPNTHLTTGTFNLLSMIEPVIRTGRAVQSRHDCNLLITIGCPRKPFKHTAICCALSTLNSVDVNQLGSFRERPASILDGDFATHIC